MRRDTGVAERATPQQQQEVSDFLDAVLASAPMQYVHACLTAKVRPQDVCQHAQHSTGPVSPLVCVGVSAGFIMEGSVLPAYAYMITLGRNGPSGTVPADTALGLLLGPAACEPPAGRNSSWNSLVH